jgi:hypothetical protein
MQNFPSIHLSLVSSGKILGTFTRKRVVKVNSGENLASRSDLVGNLHAQILLEFNLARGAIG